MRVGFHEIDPATFLHWSYGDLPHLSPSFFKVLQSLTSVAIAVVAFLDPEFVPLGSFERSRPKEVTQRPIIVEQHCLHKAYHSIHHACF